MKNIIKFTLYALALYVISMLFAMFLMYVCYVEGDKSLKREEYGCVKN